MKEKIKNLNEIFASAYENYKKDLHKISEKLCQKILKSYPNHFGSNFLLGLLAARNKNYQNSIYFFQKTITINPKFIASYNNLGGAFKELGKFDQAKQSYFQAIKINSNYGNAYYNIGDVLKEEGKLKESVISYKKAVECYKKEITTKENQSNHANVFYNLAGVFKELSRLDESKNYYKKAIKIKPNYEKAYNNLGTTLKELGEFENASICYQKAIKIKPDYAIAYHNLGIVYKLLGNFNKTIDSYEKAIQYEPENLFHYYHLSDFKKEILNSDLKDKIDAIVNNKNMSNLNLAYGNFLLSKYELKGKNYKEELEYLFKGHLYYNKSTNNKFQEGTNYALKELPKIFNISNLKNSKASIEEENKKIKPIFIVGVPRCGSTLIEKVISANDTTIPIGEETAILSKFFENEKISKKNSINIKEIDGYREKLLNKFEEKGLISQKANYIFTDKSLENFFYIGLIKQIFPAAKIINCKRNFLSSIISILQNNLTGISWAHDIKNIFEYFDVYNKIIRGFNKEFPELIYDLKLEKFVNDPETESKNLMKFCKLPWNKKCLEFYKRKDVISQTASNIQVRKEIYKTSLEKHSPYKTFLDKYGKKYSWYI